MANKVNVDATPCPPVTPKVWPATRNKKKTKVGPVKESSKVEIGDGDFVEPDFGSSLALVASEMVTENESSITEEKSSITEDESSVT